MYTDLSEKLPCRRVEWKRRHRSSSFVKKGVFYLLAFSTLWKAEQCIVWNKRCAGWGNSMVETMISSRARELSLIELASLPPCCRTFMGRCERKQSSHSVASANSLWDDFDGIICDSGVVRFHLFVCLSVFFFVSHHKMRLISTKGWGSPYGPKEPTQPGWGNGGAKQRSNEKRNRMKRGNRKERNGTKDEKRKERKEYGQTETRMRTCKFKKKEE